MCYSFVNSLCYLKVYNTLGCNYNLGINSFNISFQLLVEQMFSIVDETYTKQGLKERKRKGGRAKKTTLYTNSATLISSLFTLLQ